MNRDVPSLLGKKNMLFGFFYFLATLGLGVFLAGKFRLPQEQLNIWLHSSQHSILRAAHVHGNMESILNIITGYLLCRLALKRWLSRVISILMIAGAVLHSGMLYLSGLGLTAASALLPIGAACIIVSMLMMGAGIAKLGKID